MLVTKVSTVAWGSSKAWRHGKQSTENKQTISGKSRAASGTTYLSERGWHEIGGKRYYFKSRWEVNFAAYLEWLRLKGQIFEWSYESITYRFNGIKQGVVSYKPDFEVWETKSSKPIVYEVKGFMDPKSKTKLKRMAKYHPTVKVIVIGQKQMAEIGKKLGAVIPGWVSAKRASSPAVPGAARLLQKL